VRLAEILGALSLASDAGMGLPSEQGLRGAVLAARLAKLLAVGDGHARDAYYLALLRYVGCTADADIAAEVMGDEKAMRGAMYGVDYFDPMEFFPWLFKNAGKDRLGLSRALEIGRVLSKMPKLTNTGKSHCEVGDRIAERLGFSTEFRDALFQTFERFDGGGVPRKLKGEQIALSMRIAQVASEMEIGFRLGGLDGARQLVEKRAKRGLDPRIARAAVQHRDPLCRDLEGWSAAMAAEPLPHRMLDDTAVDVALRAMGDFADLQSRWFRGHSTAVGDVVARAAELVGLPAAERRHLVRAAWIHDLGRVGIRTGIWDKPGPLTDEERERVRTHTYLTERMLSRATGLGPAALLACEAHERSDGSGYHRRVSSANTAARVLAAADILVSMTSDRPHRRAHSLPAAAEELRRMARSGSLDGDAVEAVLAASGARPKFQSERPFGLSDRELEVLRLIARGLTNKEIAGELGISAKTAGHHVEHIYEKLGVTTRAAATMRALEKQLV
jgi:HD-GYP domain-containing protein (c-di-GMP phosphodiesterase class II)